jgi:hypothetical protein
VRPPLTREEEIERAEGIIAFCKGKPFNIRKSPAWAKGWKEMASKFRPTGPTLVQCSATTKDTMGRDFRQCMRRATIGDLCVWHAKLASKRRGP